MTVIVNALLMLALFITTGNMVKAQYCAGPCEVTTGADPVSVNPKYTLSDGVVTKLFSLLLHAPY